MSGQVEQCLRAPGGRAADYSSTPRALQLAVTVDDSDSGGTIARWTVLSDPAASSLSTNVIRIHAIDLREAQRKTAKKRAEVSARGGDPAQVRVFVDLEVMIAEDPRAAYAEWIRLERAAGCTPSSLEYVGTARGLAGLIADIHAAQVADGVTLVPHTPDVLDRILDEGLAYFEEAGLEVSQSQLALISRCRDERSGRKSTNGRRG